MSQALFRRQLALHRSQGVREDRQIQLLEPDRRMLDGDPQDVAAQPRIDVTGRLFTVPDSGGDGSIAPYRVTAGKDTGSARHHAGIDDNIAVRREDYAGQLSQKA